VAVHATSRLEGSPQGVALLLRAAVEGGISRAKIADTVRWGAWDRPLTFEHYLALVAGLRDGTPDVDRARLHALYERWLARRDEWHQLGPIVIAVLTNTIDVDSLQHDSAACDSLASALVEWDADEALNLLFAPFTGEERGGSVFLALKRQEIIQALSLRDRPRLVRRLLETALAHPDRQLELGLPDLLSFETDAPTVRQFADESGVEAARLIAKNVDADQTGFWEMLPDFITRWSDDEAVRMGLLESIVSGQAFFRVGTPTLEDRRMQLGQLVDHSNPLVADLAKQATKMIGV
jgi:hypothetical protein